MGQGAGLPGSEDVRDKLVGDGAILPMRHPSAVKRLFPSPEGINGERRTSPPQDLLVTMATGRVLLGSLLLLSLPLGLGRGPGAPVVEGTLSSEPAAHRETQKPQLGARLRRAPAGPCQLRSLTLPVAELGLGYTSEETIVFHYCAGSCPRGARTQHSLTLAWLRSQGRAHGGPCCQPTRYADVAFLDAHHRWQWLPQLSAAACGCSG